MFSIDCWRYVISSLFGTFTNVLSRACIALLPPVPLSGLVSGTALQVVLPLPGIAKCGAALPAFSVTADCTCAGAWYMESTMCEGSSSKRAIICILRCRAFSLPLLRRCLAAMQRMWSSKMKRADRRGSGRAWTFMEGLWMVIWRERLSSLSPVTSTSWQKETTVNNQKHYLPLPAILCCQFTGTYAHGKQKQCCFPTAVSKRAHILRVQSGRL